jgi:flagellar basal body-associated protein FliL
MFFRQKTIGIENKSKKSLWIFLAIFLFASISVQGTFGTRTQSSSNVQIHSQFESANNPYTFEAKIQKFLRKQLKGKVKKDVFFA